jgi:hypothetical protein
MFLGLLVLFTALSISAVAIYYSVAGLVAIFAAAAVPIIIMGSALEIGKLVTAVWLHRYWHEASWWIKTYLSIAVLVLMFITSMGIFGFLSRAHIEQTFAAQEGVAQIERLTEEIARQEAIIARAEQRIADAESSVGNNNDAIQTQIDREQQRIDTAYARIQPAIDEQNAIIEAARLADANRTAPFEQQLSALDQELVRLNNQAIQIEQRIADLQVDSSAVEPILSQISTIEESISLVQGQLAGGERAAIQAAQRTIGVDPDGAAGPNTRRAADAWIQTQQDRIMQLRSQIVDVRGIAQETVDAERQRLTTLVNDIRGPQVDAIKQRQLELLNTIDNVRSTESPVIQAARDEITRIRAGADEQIAQSNLLIQNLRNSLTVGTNQAVETEIVQQQQIIIDSNNTIDTLTQEQYALQAAYRKLEAEVGPIKYLAEFVYGEQTDQNTLEEAVRWVIVLIIFVFDPLAVLLLIASQQTFEIRKKQRDLQEGRNNNEQSFDRPNDKQSDRQSSTTERGYRNEEIQLAAAYVNRTSQGLYVPVGTGDNGGDVAFNLAEQQKRIEILETKEQDEEYKNQKQQWKSEHPDQTVKFWKDQYIKGKVDHLPWEDAAPKNE